MLPLFTRQLLLKTELPFRTELVSRMFILLAKQPVKFKLLFKNPLVVDVEMLLKMEIVIKSELANNIVVVLDIIPVKERFL